MVCGSLKFKASLVYRASSRVARDTQTLTQETKKKVISCMRVCLHVYMRTVSMPSACREKAGGGHWSPWDWSYR